MCGCARAHLSPCARVQGELQLADVLCARCGEVIGCKVLKVRRAGVRRPSLRRWHVEPACRARVMWRQWWCGFAQAVGSLLGLQNALRVGRYAIFRMATDPPLPKVPGTG